MHHSPLTRIQKGWKMIFGLGMIVAVLSGALSLLLPLEYRADAGVLIVSKSRYGVDPYTVVKSAERVGENLVQVMQTDDFYEKVKAQEGYSINWRPFEALPERKERKKWQKSVQGSVVFGTGVLNISAYNTNPRVAQDMAGAAADALVAKGWQYVGGDITMQVVNSPVATDWPVRPNIILNAVLGLMLGGLLGAFVVTRS